MRISCDTETGGLDPAVHPLLSLAFYNPDHIFYDRIKNEWFTCDPDALAINKLDPNEGFGREEFRKRVFEFWENCGKPKFELIGHNIGFDVSFIKQLNLPKEMFNYHVIDTSTLMFVLKDRKKIPDIKWNLKALCNHFGVVLDDAHNALADAKATYELYYKMIELI